MILIGIGSNLAAPPAQTPHETAKTALGALSNDRIRVLTCSAWYVSEPVPVSDQPWFVNGVAVVASDLAPQKLLDRLLALEAEFGRRRGARNGARTLDLDLLDYDWRLCDTTTLTLPHPRMHQRRFVLEPLCALTPCWRHPRLGLTAAQLLTSLPQGQPVHRIND